MEPYIPIFIVFASALLFVLLLVPLAKRVAPWLGMIDEPSERRIHKTPIPRSGGLAVFLAVHLPCAVYFLFFGSAHATAEWGFLLLGSSLLLWLGVVDDRHGVSAWVKLAFQVAVALLMYYFGFCLGGLLGIDLPFWVDLPVTVFWFVLLINAFNLIDGMDGACAGIGMISAFGMAIIMLYFKQFELAIILFALAGACLGFLRYNFHPASIFLGDCGSMLIGFLLAAVSLKSTSRQSVVVTLLVPMLAVGVPIFDVGVAVWRRLARKILAWVGKKSDTCKVFGPDLDHLHHKLIRAGLTQRRAAMVLYGGAVLACLVAFVCIAFSSLRLAFVLAGLTLLLHVAARQLVRTEMRITTQLLLRSVPRPNSFLRDAILIGLDLAWLIVSASIAQLVVFGGDFSEQVLFGMVVIPFAVLYFFGTYKILWSRSRISQMLTFALELFSGCALVLCYMWVLGWQDSYSCALATWLYWQLALIGMLGLRTAPRLLRDFGSYLSMQANPATKENALILGAGPGALLFFRRKAFYDIDNQTRKVAGFVDDDPRLFRRKVYGYPVLGNTGQLEELIKKHDIREIILTEDHYQVDALGLDVLAARYNLKLRRTHFVLQDVSPEGA